MASLSIFEFCPGTKAIREMPDPMSQKVMRRELHGMEQPDSLMFCFDAIHRLSLPGFDQVLIIRGDSSEVPAKPKRHATFALNYFAFS